jgi:hypothetical protein
MGGVSIVIGLGMLLVLIYGVGCWAALSYYFSSCESSFSICIPLSSANEFWNN